MNNSKDKLLADLTEAALAYVTCIDKLESMEGELSVKYGRMEAFWELVNDGDRQANIDAERYTDYDIERNDLHQYCLEILRELRIIYTRESSVKVILDNSGIEDVVAEAEKKQLLEPEDYQRVLSKARSVIYNQERKEVK